MYLGRKKCHLKAVTPGSQKQFEIQFNYSKIENEKSEVEADKAGERRKTRKKWYKKTL